MLRQKLVEELRVILQENYSVNLQRQQVSEVADALVSYFDLLARVEGQEQTKSGYDHDKFTNQN